MTSFRKSFVKKLEDCNDIYSLFNLVQESVKKIVKVRRDGLSLSFVNLPPYIGGIHKVGSNRIAVNKKLLKAVLDAKGEKIAKAYLFNVLLHEYIHTLGLTDESKTEIISHEILKQLFGEEHPSTLIAKNGLSSVFYLNNPEKKNDKDRVDITFYG